MHEQHRGIMVDKPGMTTKVTGKSPKNQARIGWVQPATKRVGDVTTADGDITGKGVGHSMSKMEYLWEYLYYTTN